MTGLQAGRWKTRGWIPSSKTDLLQNFVTKFGSKPASYSAEA